MIAFWNRPRRDEGIVTMADSHYFPGLEMLCLSVKQSYRVGIECFDVGITEEQKASATARFPHLRIRPVPDEPIIDTIRERLGQESLAKPGKRVWPLWICPFLIAAGSFKRVFWLDSDIVVLRHLRKLFRMLDDGPVFTPENNAPNVTPNDPALYSLLPIDRPFEAARPAVNAGVSGWNLERDRRILDDYMYPIRRACHDPRISEAISWHDQGALIWAIQNNGAERRVLDSWDWNLCAKHTAATTLRYPWDKRIVKRLRADVPAANLLHWNGLPVPWE